MEDAHLVTIIDQVGGGRWGGGCRRLACGWEKGSSSRRRKVFRTANGMSARASVPILCVHLPGLQAVDYHGVPWRWVSTGPHESGVFHRK